MKLNIVLVMGSKLMNYLRVILQKMPKAEIGQTRLVELIEHIVEHFLGHYVDTFVISLSIIILLHRNCHSAVFLRNSHFPIQKTANFSFFILIVELQADCRLQKLDLEILGRTYV